MKRFWNKVDKTDGCWLWTASKDQCGYGRFRYDGKFGFAHRWSYENANGPVPEGMEVDHVCRNRTCVNPEHLEAVTHRENIQRGYDTRTHCHNGHPLSTETMYVDVNGYNRCSRCNRERFKNYRDKNPETMKAINVRYYKRNREAILARRRLRASRVQ